MVMTKKGYDKSLTSVQNRYTEVFEVADHDLDIRLLKRRMQ